MKALPLLSTLLSQVRRQWDTTTYDNGQWQTSAYTTWGYTPTYWTSWQDTTIITITSMIPCPVTSYTTIYQCESCGETTVPPEPGPSPQPQCLTCPAQVTVINTPCDSYGETVTIPYSGWEIITATYESNGYPVVVTTCASACCAFTTANEGETTYLTGATGPTYPFHLSGNAATSVHVNSPLLLGLWGVIAGVVGVGMIAL